MDLDIEGCEMLLEESKASTNTLPFFYRVEKRCSSTHSGNLSTGNVPHFSLSRINWFIARS